MTSPHPIELNRTPNREIEIRWSDGTHQIISYRQLRDACQCATCMEKRANPVEKPKGALNILSAAEARPLEIELMAPAGNYAYNIRFSDGHSSGLFTFELLRSINSPAI